MARLPREFYNGSTVEIAQKLLGKYLVHIWQRQPLVCRITETEAYVGCCDKACHAYQYHKTARNAVMFGEPGHAYIYFIYGMYHCLNFVTEPAGEPSAVLIRGAEPICGTAAMERLRYGEKAGVPTPAQRRNLMNGPGKLCKALSLSKYENGMDLTGSELFVCETPADVGVLPLPSLPKMEKIHAAPRIGVDYAEEAREFPWRFYLESEE